MPCRRQDIVDFIGQIVEEKRGSFTSTLETSAIWDKIYSFISNTGFLLLTSFSDVNILRNYEANGTNHGINEK